MFTRDEFATEITARIGARSLLNHPFYQAWNAGTLPLDALREYAGQYYHFETAFPTFLSAVHARCESLPVRQQILANLWDEEHGEGNHTALWLRFCAALGLNPAGVQAGTPNRATAALIATYRELCGSGPTSRGMAALLAYEAQVPEVAVRKVAGLREYYGIQDPAALAFFTTHTTADAGHAATERELVLAGAVSPADRALALDAVGTALDALWGFLDGAYATAV